MGSNVINREAADTLAVQEAVRQEIETGEPHEWARLSATETLCLRRMYHTYERKLANELHLARHSYKDVEKAKGLMEEMALLESVRLKSGLDATVWLRCMLANDADIAMEKMTDLQRQLHYNRQRIRDFKPVVNGMWVTMLDPMTGYFVVRNLLDGEVHNFSEDRHADMWVQAHEQKGVAE